MLIAIAIAVAVAFSAQFLNLLISALIRPLELVPPRPLTELRRVLITVRTCPWGSMLRRCGWAIRAGRRGPPSASVPAHQFPTTLGRWPSYPARPEASAKQSLPNWPSITTSCSAGARGALAVAAAGCGGRAWPVDLTDHDAERRRRCDQGGHRAAHDGPIVDLVVRPSLPAT